MGSLPSMPAGQLPAATTDGLEEARKALEDWLKARRYHCANTTDWTRWTYAERPFWSVWAEVYGGGGVFFLGELGLHIYNDGRVVCVTNTWV